jgi:glutamate-1-semialdehyde 2,1-aminomutase
MRSDESLGVQDASDMSPEERFQALTPRSRAAYERTRSLIPAGTPGGIAQTFPHQVYITRGEGCHVWDADGRRLVDLVHGDWLYPLGHAFPAVTSALIEQAQKDPTFCFPDADLGYEIARRMLERFPWHGGIR